MNDSYIQSGHDMNNMSVGQKADYSEELIGLHINTSVAGDNKYYIVPIWRMNPTTQRNKLERYDNMHVLVDEHNYNEYDLDVRPVYVSEDSADKRPFTYWGAIEPFAGANKKTLLIDLIVTPQQGFKSICKDGDDYNLKSSNIDVVLDGTVVASNQPPIKSYVEKELPIQINNEAPFLPDLPITEDRTIQQLVDDGEKITPTDATRDKTWQWRGVTKVNDTRWTAKCRKVHLGTFAHPLDAARAYNDYVIDNGLPYVVNNIPGFLKLKFIEFDKSEVIGQFDVVELAKELYTRLNR